MFAALVSRSPCIPRYRFICGLMANCVRSTTNLPHADPQKILDSSISPDRLNYQKQIHDFCLQGDINGATTVIEKMKQSGMEMNESIFSALIIGYGKQESPPLVREIFDLMRSNGIEPGSSSIVAALSVQADKLSNDPNATDELKALCETIESEFIQFSLPQKIDIMTQFFPFRKYKIVSRLVNLLTNGGLSTERLLMKIAETTKDPAVVKKAFSVCQSNRVSNRMLNSLVKAHVLNGDFDGALKEFSELYDRYQITPYKIDLMIYCLENKRPKELQKIMRIAIERYGENNALHELATCCIICGKDKQAQRIFSEPAFGVRPDRVYAISAMLARRRNIDALEKYVRFARDIYGVDQERLNQLLVEAYERTSNPERALELWNRMQEEDVKPNEKTLLLIANLLERNNIDVPFERPRMRR